MAMTENYVSTINDVIEICKDAEQGFRGAADAVQNASLKSLFQEYSAQRAAFATELQTAVERSGGNPEHPGGAAGKLHSAWMSIKGAFTGHGEHEILAETERGEDLSLKTYRDALSHELPDALRSVVEKQYEIVQNAHARIRRLRDETAR
jgi:uncharacterized protein (TIGR02284 family)